MIVPHPVDHILLIRYLKLKVQDKLFTIFQFYNARVVRFFLQRVLKLTSNGGRFLDRGQAQ